jgi:hypothetical protein
VKQLRVRNPETYFAALLLRFGRAPHRAYADRYPDSKWGISIRSSSRHHETMEYEQPLTEFLRSEFRSPRRVLNEFLRWQARKNLIDLSIKHVTGVRKNGTADGRVHVVAGR